MIRLNRKLPSLNYTLKQNILQGKTHENAAYETNMLPFFFAIKTF